MNIYKILRPAEWDELQAKGETSGAPIDVADGYIHFSTAQQVRETVAKHFKDAGDLILLAYNADQFGDALQWEISRGDALFPHLYAPLPLAKIVRHDLLVASEQGHIFPEGLV